MAEQTENDCPTKGDRSVLRLKLPWGELLLSGKKNAELIAALACVVMGTQLWLVYRHVEASDQQSMKIYGALREMTCVLKIKPDERGAAYKLCEEMGKAQ